VNTATTNTTDHAAETADRYADLMAALLDGQAFVVADEYGNDTLHTDPDTLADDAAEVISFTEYCCNVDRWGHLEVRTYGELVRGRYRPYWSATHCDLVIGNVHPDQWVRLEGETGEVVVYRSGSVAGRRWVPGLADALAELAALLAPDAAV
jgi:hypothetical protein